MFDTHLVRLGGAGACLPRLFVVLRICTTEPDFPVDENVLSLDDESVKRRSFNCGAMESFFHSFTRLWRDGLLINLLLLLLVLLRNVSSHLRLLSHLWR